VGAKSSDIAKRICVNLASRAAELEFLGQPHMGATSDLMSVRGLLLHLAENGVFSTLGYSPQPSPELTKEMDQYQQRLMAFTRALLRRHEDKVRALAEGLCQRGELDADQVAAILGPRPSQPDAAPAANA